MSKHLRGRIGVKSLEDRIAFFDVLGVREILRRRDHRRHYTNVFLPPQGRGAGPDPHSPGEIGAVKK
jgi:hypothetical protein